MINLLPIIDRIKALLAEGSAASVTYAALEARLALEKVCYDRLRQRHDFISHYELLRRWKPGQVINTLIQEVDSHLSETMTLSIGSPTSAGIKPEDDEYVEIGTEVGFSPKRITKMWNALGRLALHVELPEHREDEVRDYGDPGKTALKVKEVLAELERLSTGTMVLSGIGEEVTFTCDGCGQKNRRRAALLRDEQTVYCIDPECKASWLVRKEGDECLFKPQRAEFECRGCGQVNSFPWRPFLEMRPDQKAAIVCHNCDHKSHVQWLLANVGSTDEQNRPDKE